MKGGELERRALGLFLEDLEVGRYWENLAQLAAARRSRKARAALERSLAKQAEEQIAVEVDSVVPAEGGKRHRVRGRAAIDRKEFAAAGADVFEGEVGGAAVRIELKAEDVAGAGASGEVVARVNGGERRIGAEEGAKLLKLERLVLVARKMEGEPADEAGRAKLGYLKRSFEAELGQLVTSLFGSPSGGFRKRGRGLEAALKKLTRLEREQVGACQDWIDANGKGMVARLRDLYGVTMFAVQFDSVLYNPLTNEEIVGGVAEKQYMKLEGEKFVRSAWVKLAVPAMPKGAAEKGPPVLSEDAGGLVEQRHRKEFDAIVALGDRAQARCREIFFENLDIRRYDENSAKIAKALREAKDALAAALGGAKAVGGGGAEGADAGGEEVRGRAEAVFHSIMRDLERQAGAPIKFHLDAKKRDAAGVRHHEHADAVFDHAIFAGTEAQRIAMMVDGEKREIEIERRSLQQAIAGQFAVVRINGKPMKIRGGDAVALLRLNKFLDMFNAKIEALEKLREKKEKINEAVKVREGIYRRLASLVESLEAEPAAPEEERPAPAADYGSSEMCRLTKAKTLEEAVGMLVGAPVKFRDERGVGREGKIAGVLKGRVIVETSSTEKLFSIFEKLARQHVNVTLENIVEVTPHEQFFIRQLVARADEAARRMKNEKLTPEHQLEVCLSVIELAERQPHLLERIIGTAREMRLATAYTDAEKAQAGAISLEHYRNAGESEKLALLKLGLDHLG